MVPGARQAKWNTLGGVVTQREWPFLSFGPNTDTAALQPGSGQYVFEIGFILSHALNTATYIVLCRSSIQCIISKSILNCVTIYPC